MPPFFHQILHILTASLSHARKILNAALAAGFRESGLSSLRTLTDPLTSFPTVAVRSSGLSLSSLIGIIHHFDSDSDSDSDSDPGNIKTLVNEEYLQLLVSVANERFVANTERITRFSNHLFLGGDDEEERIKKRGGGEGNNNDSKKRREEEWEDGEVRQARKRAEGLKIQAGLINNSIDDVVVEKEEEEEVDLSFFIPTV